MAALITLFSGKEWISNERLYVSKDKGNMIWKADFKELKIKQQMENAILGKALLGFARLND